MEYRHIPVMLKEVIEYLNLSSGKKIIDCTLGGGGYTKAILDKIGDRGQVLAIDMDDLAIENTKLKFKTEIKNKRLILAKGNFKNLLEIIKKNFLQNENIKFDGIVFDLGLSSAQLQDKTRGFSFQSPESLLNMSFSHDSTKTASEIINKYSENELIKIFKNYGEERNAKHIAKEIVKNRKENLIKTVGQLLAIINKTIGKSRGILKIHPATKIFQALRIEVNDELENLKQVLPQTLELLNVNGVIIAVSYHSLEDRIVKQFFKQESRDCLCLPICPDCRCNHKVKLKILTSKAVRPSEEEIALNPRSRSAKLRVASLV